MENYQKLYAFLPYFEGLAAARKNQESFSESFVIRQEMMYVEYSQEMERFAEEVYASGFVDTNYSNTLKEYGVESEVEMGERLITADVKLLKAVLTNMMRAERFVSGAWAAYEEQGLFLTALRRMYCLNK